MADVISRFVTVEGLRTHLLEAGTGQPVVMLHSGEYGASSRTSWGHLVAPIAEAGYHVVAPDWLGFGDTDKVVDFVDPKGRRMRHIAAVVAQLGLDRPAFIGNSMGGTYLATALAERPGSLPTSAAVLVSGGGFAPDNEARRSILSYDLTQESMARIVRAVTHTPRLADDEEYVRWRHALSLEPGAWQCIESARLRPPGSPPSGDFGKPDRTVYEQISVPTLVIAGEHDKLRLPRYAHELARRIPDSELLVYGESGHMPNLEEPTRFVEDVVSFLDRRYNKPPRQGASPAADPTAEHDQSSVRTP